MIPCSIKTSYQDIFISNNITIDGKADFDNQNQLTIQAITNNERYTCKTQLSGLYNIQNIWAAIAIGMFFNVPATQIFQALEAYQVKNMRSQIFKEGTNTIIMDAYNANPTSMSAALENLKSFEGEKIAVLGDMLELGDEADNFHREISKQALAIKQLKLVTVGPLFGNLTLHENRQYHFDNCEDAGEWLLDQNPKNTTILFKGSRGIGIEKTYQIFKNKNIG